MGRPLLIAAALAPTCLVMCTSFGSTPEDATGGEYAGPDANVPDALPPPGADANVDRDAGEEFHPCIEVRNGCARMMFVTSQTYPSALGNLSAADMHCQAAALASPDPRIRMRHFRAWLSNTTVEARDRFPHDGAILRPDFEYIALDWTQLVSGTIELEPAVDENDVYIGPAAAWTGTAPTGQRYSTISVGSTCSDWTGVGTSARAGSVQGRDGSWSSASDRPCSEKHHLYCLEW